MRLSLKRLYPAVPGKGGGLEAVLAFLLGLALYGRKMPVLHDSGKRKEI